MSDLDHTQETDLVEAESGRRAIDDPEATSSAEADPASKPAVVATVSDGSAADSAQALAQLRNLLLGPEQQEIKTIRNRIDNSDLRADDVADVLPDAVARSAARDDRLAKALAPSIGSAIKTSVQKDPTPLVDAIFPIIGPAIRRSISDALSGMMQSLNQAMEHSFSIQGLRWRIQAARTGKPFAEIVLLNTLKYRVEQVFLIHAETGLLLHHVGASGAHVADERMVSGMITAIQDFVRDSFGGKDEHLDRMRVGGMVVRIERGPDAVLAAVIRGTPSEEVGQTLQEAVEQIHRDYAETLDAFKGDISPFQNTAEVLKGCLLLAAQKKVKPKISLGLMAFLVVLVTLIGLLAYWRTSRAARWNDYVQELRATPGLVVIEEHRGWSTHLVHGLRDPLAADPGKLLEAHGIDPDRVDADWRMYQSLDAPIAAMRQPPVPDPETELLRLSKEVLQPPAGVTLSVNGTTIIATGESSHAWIESAKVRVKDVPGLEHFDLSGVNDLHLVRVRELIAGIEGSVITFESGRTEVATGKAEQIAGVAVRLIEMAGLAEDLGLAVAVRVVGHSDPAGDEVSRQRVSQARADYILAGLLRHGPGLPTMMAVGVGASQPVRADRPGEADRRVSFVVEITQAVRN